MIYVGYLIRALVNHLATKHYDDTHAEHYSQQQRALVTGVAISIGATCSDDLVVERDGIRVAVQFAQSRNKINTVTWRLLPAPPGFPVFKFTPNSKPKKAQTALPWLDAAFKITASDEAALKELWSPLRCQRLLRLLNHAHVESTGREMTITFAPPLVYPQLIENGLEMMFDLAKADPYAVSDLRKLGTLVTVELPYVVVAAPAQIHIGLAREGERLVTQATIAVPAVPDAALARLHDLGATKVENVDGQIRLRCSEVIRDGQKLRDLAAILREVATPSEGVFR